MRRATSAFALALAATLALSGCESTSYEGPALEEHLEDYAVVPAVEPAGDEVTLTLPRPDGSGYDTVTRPRMLRVTTSLVLQVEDFSGTLESIRELLNDHDGYLARLSYLRPTDEPAAGWLLQLVDVAERDRLLRRLGALGEVLREERYTVDVSLEYHTADAELRDLRAQHAALERQLEEAGTAEATELRYRLLTIENEEAALLAQYPSLDGASGVTPVYLTLTAEEGLIADPAARLTGAGFTRGYIILLHVLRVLIIVLVVGVPVSGLGLGIFLLIRRLRRRRKA